MRHLRLLSRAGTFRPQGGKELPPPSPFKGKGWGEGDPMVLDHSHRSTHAVNRLHPLYKPLPGCQLELKILLTGVFFFELPKGTEPHSIKR